MTDLPEERIAALAARRAAAGPARRGTKDVPTAPGSGRRKRRPHAAAGSRVLATGLSVSAALTLAGVMASTQKSEPVVTQPVAAAAPATTAPPVVIRVVVVPTTAKPGATSATPATAAPTPAPTPAPVVRKAPVHAKAVATSRGS